MSKTLIIDANSIGYAHQHATKLSAGGIETQAAFGFIKTMRDLREEYPDYQPLILWDGKAEWRFALHPDYKSNRSDDPKKVKVKEAYAIQRPYIMRALSHLGIRQMTADKYEADDMAGYFVSLLSKNPQNKITLISGDRDWIQLVRPNVTWRDKRDDSRIVKLDNLFNKTGFKTPYQFLEGKCLEGDSSDVISGVGGIGEKGAPEFIAEFGSVREFWRRCNSGEFVPKKKAHTNLWKGPGRAIFGRNLRLMQLLKVPAPKKEEVRVEPQRFDQEKFAKVCEELAFTSILRDMERFTRLFRSSRNG
jgi:DNA polymerase-1